MSLNLLVYGITGRMGQMVVEQASGFCTISGGISNEVSALENRNIAGTEVSISPAWDESFSDTNLVIDFSNVSALDQVLELCSEKKLPVVICTTGFSDKQKQAIEKLSSEVAVVLASNTSVGVTVLNKLVTECARYLSSGYDIEIFEAHHRNKVDSPSGTALTLFESVLKGKPGLKRGEPDRNGKRKTDEVGFSVVRAGGIYGDHSVLFTSENEQIELRHRALNRKLFADGALFAAKWLYKKAPATGLFSMEDILFEP